MKLLPAQHKKIDSFFGSNDVEDEVEGVSWTSKLIAYQDLTRKSAFSYAMYGTGETDYEVPVKDDGIELRYRRPPSR